MVFSGAFVFFYFVPEAYLPRDMCLRWYEPLIILLSGFYLFKIRTFNAKDLAVSLFLGITACFSRISFDGYSCLDALMVAVSYYSSCQIFRKYAQDKKFFDLNIKSNIKSFLLGIVFAMPFVIIGNLSLFVIDGIPNCDFSIYNIFVQFYKALSTVAVTEIWRFFLLAVALDLFKGEIYKNSCNKILVYILMTLPHCLSTSLFMVKGKPILGIVRLLILMIISHELPISWIMKTMNLQTAIGFEWIINFARNLFPSIL